MDHAPYFAHNQIDPTLLRQYAYNLRWAQQDPDVIPLTAADPDFPSAPQIAEALTSFVKNRYFPYCPPEGLPEFRLACSHYFSDKRGVVCTPNEFIATDSAAYGIMIACKAILKPGDEAIIFNPVDFLFRYCVESVGATAISFPIPAEQPNPDWDQLKSKISPQTKLICLCNPLNPTGKLFTREELETLYEIAEVYNLLILSDEIWSDIVFDGRAFTSIASLHPNAAQKTITVHGFSKSYGLAGLRMGWLHSANKEWYARLLQVSDHTTTVHGANLLSQIAATAALNDAQDWLKEFVSYLEKRRNQIVEGLSSLPGFTITAPQACYVAFAQIRDTQMSSQQMYDFLLKKARVACVPGLSQWFGSEAEGYIRFSFATSEETIAEALKRIKGAVNTLSL